ncbi:MAG: hypothetical protein ACK5OB_04570 [Pirellula sp.]
MATAVASGIAMHGVGLHSVGGQGASGIGGSVVGTKMVQQTFGWDACESVLSVPVTKAPRTTELREEGATRGPVRSRRSQPARTAVAPRVTVPTVSVTSSQRRGRCEHIGGVMASVLGKYGLTLDDLQRAIEELEAQQAVGAL